MCKRASFVFRFAPANKILLSAFRDFFSGNLVAGIQRRLSPNKLDEIIFSSRMI